MKKRLLASAVLVCALTLGACAPETSTEEKKDTASEEKTETKSEVKKEAASADDAAPSKGVFYKVEKDGNTVYLFGSIHVGNQDTYPLDENVERAFDEADHLAVEVDITALDPTEAMTVMTEFGTYQDGRSLSDVISEDLFEKALDFLPANDEESLNMLKPWHVQETISMLPVEEAGYASEEGIDFYFLNRAAEDNLNIIGLETLEDQMSITDILSDDNQVASLKKTIDEYDKIEEDFMKLMDAWQTGDIDTLSRLRSEAMGEMDNENYQEYAKALLDDRDEGMTNKIEEFLSADKDETYFVVVGALHLVGEKSIVGLLKDRGYEVQEGI